MSKSCKLPNCYPVSFDVTESVVSLDNFQDTQPEITVYSVDSNNEEMEPVSLSVGVYDSESLSALGIITDGIYRIDFPNNANFKVSLYSENSFKGTTFVLFKSTSDLRALTPEISSIVIEDTAVKPKMAPSVIKPSTSMVPTANGVQLPPGVVNKMPSGATSTPTATMNRMPPAVMNQMAPSTKGAAPAILSQPSSSTSEKSVLGSMMDIIDETFPTRFIGGIANSTLIFIILLIFILTGLLR